MLVLIASPRAVQAIALLGVVSLIASCAFPRSGPSKQELYAGADQVEGNVHVLVVNDRIIEITSQQSSFGFSDRFRTREILNSDTIYSGDTISVTVFENVTDDPLLGSTGQRVSGLNEMQVDSQGYIFIPYAGRIRVSGQSPEQVRQAITSNLESQTPNPQVQVQRLAGDGASVSISGSASVPGIYPIEAPTRTLAAMLAKAGGVAIDPDVAIVRVSRDKYVGKVWLTDLYENPELDIALRPGDQIFIDEDSRKFIALGATGVQSVVPFSAANLSALEAIAAVGGLSGTSADPTGVFILRDESPEKANAILGRGDLTRSQRIVYVFDLTGPFGLFTARDFLVRDGDTLYVTDAPFVKWQKTISAITGTIASASSIPGVDGS